MKRAQSSSDASAPEPKKRNVVYATYQKWKSDTDQECLIVTWLDCDTELSGRKKIVTKLRCSVCAKFKRRIATRRNFSERWLLGAESVRASNIHNHARADQHIYAMSLLKQEHARASGSGCSSYCPSNLEKWPIKFDIGLTNGLPNIRSYFVLCACPPPAAFLSQCTHITPSTYVYTFFVSYLVLTKSVAVGKTSR